MSHARPIRCHAAKSEAVTRRCRRSARGTKSGPIGRKGIKQPNSGQASAKPPSVSPNQDECDPRSTGAQGGDPCQEAKDGQDQVGFRPVDSFFRHKGECHRKTDDSDCEGASTRTCRRRAGATDRRCPAGAPFDAAPPAWSSSAFIQSRQTRIRCYALRLRLPNSALSAGNQTATRRGSTQSGGDNRRHGPPVPMCVMACSDTDSPQECLKIRASACFLPVAASGRHAIRPSADYGETKARIRMVKKALTR